MRPPPPEVFPGVGGREKNFQGGLRVDLGPVVVVVVVVVVIVVVVVAGSDSHPALVPASGCCYFQSHDIQSCDRFTSVTFIVIWDPHPGHSAHRNF
jgi:hypothetical protein